MSSRVDVGPVAIGGGAPLVLIAGPCVIERPGHAESIARRLADIGQRVGIGVVFKASFDKANRTRLASYRGPGLAEGLAVLENVRAQTGLPVLTDVHEVAQVEPVAAIAECLQIPAFLCRQTDLLVAAGKTERAINIKKGQFLAPLDMRFAVEKVGHARVLVTERGSAFGHGDLIVDYRGLSMLAATGCPVVFDATHSVQQPGGGTTGGVPEHIPALARAAIAVGVDALFMEVHDDPPSALSDGANAMKLDLVEPLVAQLLELDRARRRIFG